MADNIDSEIAGLENLMANDRAAYFRDPANGERYRELVDARDGGTAALSARSGTAKELATIEARMRDDRDGYFRDTEMQARYRELIAGGADAARATPKPEPKAPAPATPEASPSIPPHLQAEVAAWAETDAAKALVADWQEKGGWEANAKFADNAAAEFVLTLPEETRNDFAMQFDILPIGLQMAMRGELANLHVARGFATSEQVAHFASTDEGAALVREWGEASPRLVHVIRERAARIAAKLSPKEREAFGYFIESVTPEEFSAMMRLLAKAA